jgi:hypothetical protein
LSPHASPFLPEIVPFTHSSLLQGLRKGSNELYGIGEEMTGCFLNTLPFLALRVLNMLNPDVLICKTQLYIPFEGLQESEFC